MGVKRIVDRANQTPFLINENKCGEIHAHINIFHFSSKSIHYKMHEEVLVDIMCLLNMQFTDNHSIKPLESQRRLVGYPLP